MTEFFLPMVPPTTTAQMHKVAIVKGRPRFYDPREVVEMKAKLKAHLAGHVPEQPFEGPVRLSCTWIWPGPHGIYKPTKPDTDNLQKALKDIMTRLGYWGDDAQVASEIIEKFTGETTGIYIKIEALDQQKRKRK